jgi:hypothetical protein
MDVAASRPNGDVRVTAFDARYNASPPGAPVTVTTDTTAPSTPGELTVGAVTASTFS